MALYAYKYASRGEREARVCIYIWLPRQEGLIMQFGNLSLVFTCSVVLVWVYIIRFGFNIKANKDKSLVLV